MNIAELSDEEFHVALTPVLRATDGAASEASPAVASKRLVQGPPTTTDRWVEFTETERDGERGTVDAPSLVPLTFTPHWFSFSLDCGAESKALACKLIADHFLGASFQDSGADHFDDACWTVNHFYASMSEAKYGIKVLSGAKDQRRPDHVAVVLPGDAFDNAPGGGLHALASLLSHLRELETPDEDRPALWWQCTRVDLAFDGCPFTVQDCVRAALPGVLNLRSPAKRGRGTISLGEVIPGEDGSTFNWGRRTSERCIRVYDRRGPVRLELETHKERANIIARVLMLANPDQWAYVALQHVRDFIDFVDRAADPCITRCPMLPWWSAFVGNAPKAKARLEKPENTVVAKTIGNINRFRRTLAKAVKGFGLAYVVKEMEFGTFRFSARDRRDIAELRTFRELDPGALGISEAIDREFGKWDKPAPPLLAQAFPGLFAQVAT